MLPPLQVTRFYAGIRTRINKARSEYRAQIVRNSSKIDIEPPKKQKVRPSPSMEIFSSSENLTQGCKLHLKGLIVLLYTSSCNEEQIQPAFCGVQRHPAVCGVIVVQFQLSEIYIRASRKRVAQETLDGFFLFDFGTSNHNTKKTKKVSIIIPGTNRKELLLPFQSPACLVLSSHVGSRATPEDLGIFGLISP